MNPVPGRTSLKAFLKMCDKVDGQYRIRPAHPVIVRYPIERHPGILAEAVENSGGRRHFVRVKVDNAGNVRSAGIQASHVLSSVANANGLLDVPPRTMLTAGTVVQVLRWD